VKVKDVLRRKTREMVTAEVSTSVTEAMKLLIENQIGCLPVLGYNDQVVGIVSDTDIFKTIYNHPDSFQNYTAGNLMTTDVLVGLPEDEIDYIGGVMTKNGIRHVPILEQGKLVGIVTISDIARAQIRRMEIENRYLKMYMEGNPPG
jgi:CBS domain-containing protein